MCYIKYSEDFVKEVKELYPNDEFVYQLLDNGSKSLGRVLADSIQYGVDIKFILNANTLEEVKDQARIIIRYNKLYQKWCKECNIN